MLRFLLFVMLISEALSYMVLTEARYLGQGLEPLYHRFTTVGDVLSVIVAGVTLALIIHAMIRPHWMSPGRTLAATTFALVLLWLDYGVKRFEASEFSPTASIALILSTSALIGILATRSNPDKRKGRRMLRVFRNCVLVFLTLMAFSFIYSFSFPSYTEPEEIRRFDADAGVVLGAAVWRGKGLGDRPSPTLRERIDVGYDLLQQKLIPRLVVTGASAPGEQAEAEVAKQEFVKRGVDESRLIAENRSRSSLDQVIFMRDELYRKQGWERFVIVSDQYHLARVVEMCRFNGIHAIGSPSRIRQPFLDLAFYRMRESAALLAYWLIGK